MLDLIGSVVALAAIAVNLVAFTSVLTGDLSRRLTMAAIVGAWIGLAIGLGAAGRLAFSPQQPVPLVAVLFATPLVLTAVLAWRSRGVRAALTGIPMSLLIGLNTFRVLGVLFLLLAAAGRLGGPFPLSAGWGDILTGTIAVPLALVLARKGAMPAGAIWLWNAFGTLDLIAAVGLGLLSANGSPLQLIHAGAGSQAMQYLPFALIPTVLVPFYLITHAIVAAQLWQRGAVRAANAPLAARGSP